MARRVGILVVVWGLVAYLVLPVVWELYFHWHPRLDEIPGITQTKVGIPGDPINVALVGTDADIEKAMTAAGWHAADSLGLKSDVRIAADTVLERPYDAAPVSSLYLFGRREDLAFEKPVGGSPQHRNHVRYWKTEQRADDGRPLWVGSASYDKGVGLSHTTGEITHHIDEDVDAERQRLFDDLKQSGDLEELDIMPAFHATLSGKNGGGDPWKTDGALWIGILKSGPGAAAAQP